MTWQESSDQANTVHVSADKVPAVDCRLVLNRHRKRRTFFRTFTTWLKQIQAPGGSEEVATCTLLATTILQMELEVKSHSTRQCF